MIELILSNEELFNNAAGVFTISLGLIALLSRKKWISYLTSVIDSEKKDPVTMFFKAHMSRTSVRRATIEHHIVVAFAIVLGLVMIFLL